MHVINKICRVPDAAGGTGILFWDWSRVPGVIPEIYALLRG